MKQGVTSQIYLDKIIKKQAGLILKTLRFDCVDISDGTYYLSCMTHDLMKMTYSIISRNSPTQEAKAAFKIMLDEVLLDYGMSVAIHEFN